MADGIETKGGFTLCPQRANPRDVSLDGASIHTVAASGLEVCLGDPAVGIALMPEDLVNLHPVANAGEDRTIRRRGSAPSPRG